MGSVSPAPSPTQHHPNTLAEGGVPTLPELRVVSQRSLSSGSSGPCPLPWEAAPCPPPSGAEPFPHPPALPNTTPCHSLRPSQRSELSAALHSSHMEAVGHHKVSFQFPEGRGIVLGLFCPRIKNLLLLNFA